jgi:hypothetical protein
MKIEELIIELKNKDCYKEAKRQFPNFFFCAAFIIIDLEQKNKKIQLDFFLPNENKIISFEHPFENFKKHDDKINNINKQPLIIKINIEHLEETIKNILDKNNIKNSPSKIIAILKNNEWNITAMDSVFGISRIKIDAISGKEISFEKGSLLDFMGIKKK